MIRFLTPSFYQSRHHSIADAIIRLLTLDLMIVFVGKTLIFPQFQEVARVIDEMKLIGRELSVKISIIDIKVLEEGCRELEWY